MARGVLYGVLHGDLDGVKDICDLTSLAAIARALGPNEGELAIHWDDHLSPAEASRIQGFYSDHEG